MPRTRGPYPEAFRRQRGARMPEAWTGRKGTRVRGGDGLLAVLALILAAATPVGAGPRVHQAGSDGVDRGADVFSGVRDTTAGDTTSVVQVGSGLATINGTVSEAANSEPVPSATVSLQRLNRPGAEGLRTRTDAFGRFRFEGIPSGEYVLSTHHIGFQDRADTIRLAQRALLDLDVSVSTRAVELPPLQVTVRSAWLADTGFYWRKERGLGQFLTPEEISRRGAQSFSGLVRGLQGVQVVRVCDGGGFPCPRRINMRHTNDARACRVKYFMDGQPLTGRVHPDDISARDIAAVEIYRSISETPARFYGRCGSVVMWSKRYDPRADNQ